MGRFSMRSPQPGGTTIGSHRAEHPKHGSWDKYAQKHYSAHELACIWRLSPQTIQSLFVTEPGVLVIPSHPTQISIPAAVANAVYNRISSRACGSGEVFDVVLAHNNKDKAAVEAIGKRLRQRRLNPWFDKWNIPPGRNFQREINEVLRTARSLPGGYGYYVCRGKAPAVQSCRDQKCPARFVPAQQLDELVWTDLCHLLTEPKQLAQGLARAHAGNWLPQEWQARREGLRKGQTSLEQQLERLTKAYLDGIVGLEELGRRRSEGEQRRQALLRQQAQLEAQVDRQTEVAHLALSLEDFCRRTREGLAQASFEQKRHLMELLVDRVVVTEGEVEIRYVMPTTSESERLRFCQLRSDHRNVSQNSQIRLPGPAI